MKDKTLFNMTMYKVCPGGKIVDPDCEKGTRELFTEDFKLDLFDGNEHNLKVSGVDSNFVCL